jgi:hypothetical protein
MPAAVVFYAGVQRWRIAHQEAHRPRQQFGGTNDSVRSCGCRGSSACCRPLTLLHRRMRLSCSSSCILYISDSIRPRQPGQSAVQCNANAVRSAGGQPIRGAHRHRGTIREETLPFARQLKRDAPAAVPTLQRGQQPCAAALGRWRRMGAPAQRGAHGLRWKNRRRRSSFRIRVRRRWHSQPSSWRRPSRSQLRAIHCPYIAGACHSGFNRSGVEQPAQCRVQGDLLQPLQLLGSEIAEVCSIVGAATLATREALALPLSWLPHHQSGACFSHDTASYAECQAIAACAAD